MTPDRSPEPAERAAWQAARGHADVAHVILVDPDLPARESIVHLTRGWWALAGTAERPAAGASEALLARGAESLAALDGYEAGRHAPDRDRLLALARDLEFTLQAEEQRRFGHALARARRDRVLRWIAAALVALTPLWAYLIFVPFTFREGSWRGEFFPEVEFGGEGYVRRDSGIDFNWKKTSPSLRIPEDKWSARWDTCLILPEPAIVVFQLTSDDGSRLFVDGDKVVDNWGEHGIKNRGREVQLADGVRHIRVEYFDMKDDAQIELDVSLDGGVPTHLPTRQLIYPGDELDAADPCGAARASYALRSAP